MRFNKKFILPLILILLMVILPQAFAGNIDNKNITDDLISSTESNDIVIESVSDMNKTTDGYKYVTTPEPSEAYYVPEESSFIHVTAEYETEDYWNSLDLKGSNMYVYINGSTSGIELSNIASESQDFIVNINDIDYDFKINNTYSLTFSAPKGLLDYASVDRTTQCKFNPLILHVVESLPENNAYETKIVPNTINHIRGESNMVTVVSIYDSKYSKDLSYSNMQVYINEDNGLALNDIKANSTSFIFNITDIEDKLSDGINKLTFHPNTDFLEGIIEGEFIFGELLINVSAQTAENKTSKNIFYESSTEPSNVDYYKGNSSLVTVTINYNETLTNDYINSTAMRVFVNNGEEGILIDNVKGGVKSFTFDLLNISDNLVNGKNTLVFHPNISSLETAFGTTDFNKTFIPLTVNVISNETANETDTNNSSKNDDESQEDNRTIVYQTIPSKSDINYTLITSQTITVNVEYDEIFAELNNTMFVYINGEEIDNRVTVNDAYANSTSFTFDLNQISDKLTSGTNRLTFHPHTGFLEGVISGRYVFNPITVNVNDNADDVIVFESAPLTNNLNYTVGKSYNITVNVDYNTSYADKLESYLMYAYVNGEREENKISLNGIFANQKTFQFDLLTAGDKFINGVNTVTFHPNTNVLEKNIPGKYVFNPLIINVEIPVQYIYVSTEGSDENNGSEESPVASISKAIELVKTTGISNIIVNEGIYYENAITVDASLTMTGKGNVIIDAEQLDRIFKISGAYDVSLYNLTLINGKAPVDGVTEDIHEIVYYAAGGAIAISNDAYVNITDLIFINNTADSFGGAINSESPFTIVKNSIFIGNLAGIFGGAIDFEDINASVDNCTFIGNDATNGGAIGWIGDNAIIINSYFENNTAEVGAAVFIENTHESYGNLIQYCTFINNEAIEQGGAIEVENEQMSSGNEYTQIRNCEFINNYAYNGGAISGYYGDVASIDNIFINNTASYGGAIATISAKSYLSYVGKLYLRNNTIIDCVADENGNGIFTMGYIDSVLNITFIDGKTIHIPDGKAVTLNVTVMDDMGNLISGSPLDFTVNGKATINPASDLIDGFGQVRYVPRENGTIIVSGIYGNEWDMNNYHNVITGKLIVENAIADYFGTVYVDDLEGDDDNTGSEASPVKTFTQGYLLAAREGGSYNIIVGPGTYYVPGYTLEQSFNVTGIGNPILDGKNEGTLFALYGSPNDEFHFTGLTFTNGVAKPSQYSGMYDGGAIFFKGGNLYLVNDIFNRNSANDYGGAVYINKGLDMNSGELYGAYAEITNCTFNNNYAKYDGGAIGLYDCDVLVINSTFNTNSAKYGGAISILIGMGNLTVINSTFSKNTASDSAGALEIEALNTYNTRYFANIINSTFIANSAGFAGAILGQDTNITNCIFKDNFADSYGGAVVLSDNESTISNSVFEGNMAVEGSAYKGNSSLINDNYWGSAVESSKELSDKNIVITNSDDEIKSWYNSLEDLINSKPTNNLSQNSSNVNETNNTSENNTTYGNITDGKENNQNQTNTTPVTINKIKTTLTVSDKTFKVTKSKKISATLKDENNNPIVGKLITFTVNGVNYYGKTDENGTATVKVTLNKAKTFICNVVFEGYVDYENASNTSNIKVVKEKSKLTVSKKVFKAKTKTKKVKVTLKSASKKAIKKVKVTIKIKGKTYKVKTNSKGVALIKVKLTKKGTYKAKVKFAGNKLYKSVTKTVKIKIK